MRRIVAGLVFAVGLLGSAAAASGLGNEAPDSEGGVAFDCPKQGLGGMVVNALPDPSQAMPLEGAVSAGLADAYGSPVDAAMVAANLEVIADTGTYVTVQVSEVIEGEPVQMVLAKVGDGYVMESLVQCQPFLDEAEEPA